MFADDRISGVSRGKVAAANKAHLPDTADIQKLIVQCNIA